MTRLRQKHVLPPIQRSLRPPAKRQMFRRGPVPLQPRVTAATAAKDEANREQKPNSLNGRHITVDRLKRSAEKPFECLYPVQPFGHLRADGDPVTDLTGITFLLLPAFLSDTPRLSLL